MFSSDNRYFLSFVCVENTGKQPAIKRLRQQNPLTLHQQLQLHRHGNRPSTGLDWWNRPNRRGRDFQREMCTLFSPGRQQLWQWTMFSTTSFSTTAHTNTFSALKTCHQNHKRNFQVYQSEREIATHLFKLLCFVHFILLKDLNLGLHF